MLEMFATGAVLGGGVIEMGTFGGEFGFGFFFVIVVITRCFLFALECGRLG